MSAPRPRIPMPIVRVEHEVVRDRHFYFATVNGIEIGNSDEKATMQCMARTVRRALRRGPRSRRSK